MAGFYMVKGPGPQSFESHRALLPSHSRTRSLARATSTSASKLSWAGDRGAPERYESSHLRASQPFRSKETSRHRDVHSPSVSSAAAQRPWPPQSSNSRPFDHNHAKHIAFHFERAAESPL